MADAFPKDCAPSVEEIGAYALVTSCAFSEPPDPIVTPIDPPIPFPPIDEGCYELSLTGTFHGPDTGYAGDTGSLGVEVTYPTGDVCEPIIDLQLFIPCYTKISGGPGTASYDPLAVDASLDLAVIVDSSSGADQCDFQLSLNLVLPCPTEILAGDATVQYRPTTPDGDLEIIPSAVPGTCDFSLDFNLTLPCPGTISASVAPGTENPCIARQPAISVEAVNLLDSSSQITCSYDLQFALNVPCPIDWGDPDQHSVRVTEVNSVGAPSGQLFINPDLLSSSSGECGQEDCFPRLLLDLSFPCPADFSGLAGDVSIYAEDDLGADLPWVEPPGGALAVTYAGGQVCDPVLQLSLNLPCPISLLEDPDASVSAEDDDYWTGVLSGPSATTQRRWAFGQPTASVNVSLGEVGGVETPCFPSLDLNLNLPCPAGGIHRDADELNSDESALLSARRDAYGSQYGAGDGALHPYYNKIPAGKVTINRNLNLEIMPQPLPPGFGSINGLWGRTEFNENCELDLDLSLYIPCGVRSPQVAFHDIAYVGSGANAPELPSTEYDALVWQDWADYQAGDPCAYVEDLHLFVTPGGGSGSGSGLLLLGRIYAVNLRMQLALIDPIELDADPTFMGQGRDVNGAFDPGEAQGVNVWSEESYQTYFDTGAASRFCAWTGGWTGAVPGDPVICIKFPNCQRWLAFPMMNLTGMPPNTYLGQPADPDWKFAPPCDDLLGPADPTTIDESVVACGTIPTCSAPTDGGCWYNGPNDLVCANPY